MFCFRGDIVASCEKPQKEDEKSLEEAAISVNYRVEEISNSCYKKTEHQICSDHRSDIYIICEEKIMHKPGHLSPFLLSFMEAKIQISGADVAVNGQLVVFAKELFSAHSILGCGKQSDCPFGKSKCSCSKKWEKLVSTLIGGFFFFLSQMQLGKTALATLQENSATSFARGMLSR